MTAAEDLSCSLKRAERQGDEADRHPPEALSSAHQLDQLREAMNRMQGRPQAAGEGAVPAITLPAPTSLHSLLHFRIGPFALGPALCPFLCQALSSPGSWEC